MSSLNTAAPLADVPKVGLTVTVLLPTVNPDEVPHVKVTVDVAPLEVPRPLIVAVVPVTEVAATVVTEGAPGVAKVSIAP